MKRDGKGATSSGKVAVNVIVKQAFDCAEINPASRFH